LFFQLHFEIEGKVTIPDGGELKAEAKLSLNAQVTLKIIGMKIDGKASISAGGSVTGKISFDGVLTGEWRFGEVAGTVEIKVVTGWIWVSESTYENKLVLCEGWGDTFGSTNLLDQAKQIWAGADQPITNNNYA